MNAAKRKKTQHGQIFVSTPVSTSLYRQISTYLGPRGNRSALIRASLQHTLGDIPRKGQMKGDPHFLSIQYRNTEWTLCFLRELGYELEAA